MARKDKFDSFLFDVDAFESDGVVEAMSAEQVGAYIRLLCKAWRETPCGTIPDDDEVLARWARLPAKKWIAARDRVLAAFKLQDGRWHQKRMKQTYSELVEKKKVLSKSGQRGANNRWRGHSEANGDPNGEANADGMAKRWQNDGIQKTKTNSISNNQSKVLPLTAAQFGKKEFSDDDWKRELCEISRLVGDTTEDRRILGQLAWLVCAGAPITQQLREAIETVKLQRDDGKPPDSPVAYLRGTLEKSVGKDTLAAMLKRAPARKHFSEATEAL